MTIGRSLASSAVFQALRLGIRPPGSRTLQWYASLAQLRRLIVELDVNCLLDVGANIGTFSWTVRKLGYKGNIVCFEPLPENREKIAALAAGDPYWEVVGFHGIT